MSEYSSPPPVPLRVLDTQELVPVSEDWASDEEDYDYGCYYGEDDNDVHCLAEGRELHG